MGPVTETRYWIRMYKHAIFEEKKIAINLRSLVSVLDYSYIVVPGNWIQIDLPDRFPNVHHQIDLARHMIRRMPYNADR
jgi:hypothetical protein